MSRFKRYAHSVASSYVLLAVNTAYTLASVPLALSYLSKPEFGVWALAMTIGGYLLLVDLGMGSSFSRLLIDHKDRRETGDYGSMIKTGFVVGAVQGVLVLVAGLVIAWGLSAWLGVPDELESEFFWLMAGQAVLVCLGFVCRIFIQILHAWQRVDVANFAQCAGLIVGFVALWFGFQSGWGVLSLLAANGLTWLVTQGINIVACRRLHLLPRGAEWGVATWQRFRELFVFGLDVFLIAIGTQLIVSSQTVLVARGLGVEASAVWSVATRAFTLVCQLVWRVWINSMPAMGEMIERGEMERLWRRYHAVFSASNVLAVAAGVVFAALNGRFIEVWSRGRIVWPETNNWLLGLWLVLLTQTGCHNSLIISFKQIRALKFFYLIEGAVFIGVGWLALARWGFTGMLVCSLICTAIFTLAYGTYRIGELSRLGWRAVVFQWQARALLLAVLLTAVAVPLQPLQKLLPGWAGLLVGAAPLGLVAAVLVWFVGLSRELVAEITQRIRAKLGRSRSA
jgi:O-antigen/teichoic acid export membrane protein